MSDQASELATFGGGCFWCLEPVFGELRGVINVESGYAGGTVVNPTYKEICTGTTGHAEVIQLAFNPGIISYRELLEVFFTVHDPTTLNRQGNDVGSQYRSVIFYHSLDQKRAAEEVIAELEKEKIWDDPIVTEIEFFKTFYRAEDYHQNYYQQNPDQPYCRFIIAPKVAKFRKKFLDKLKKK